MRCTVALLYNCSIPKQNHNNHDRGGIRAYKKNIFPNSQKIIVRTAVGLVADSGRDLVGGNEDVDKEMKMFAYISMHGVKYSSFFLGGRENG